MVMEYVVAHLRTVDLADDRGDHVKELLGVGLIGKGEPVYHIVRLECVEPSPRVLVFKKLVDLLLEDDLHVLHMRSKLVSCVP